MQAALLARGTRAEASRRFRARIPGRERRATLRPRSTMDPAERIGEVIGYRYRLDELLSRGGQGWVFAGTDLRHGDPVALKVLRGEFANDPESRERMYREAQALMRLGRASVVRILDQVYSDAGELCLVMERLQGSDFEAFLGAREDRGER